MPASNLQTILAALRSWGLTREQAAGVAGNLAVESKFSPTAANPREGAIGIAQWEGGRRAALQQYAAAHGTTETDLIAQLGFMQQELQGPEAGAFTRLKAAGSPTAAADVFDQYYERSDGSARATREKDAQQIANDSFTLGDFVSDPLGSLGSATGGAVSTVTGALNWQSGVLKIALYVVAGAASAGLVIVGAVHTVSN